MKNMFFFLHNLIDFYVVMFYKFFIMLVILHVLKLFFLPSQHNQITV